MVERLHTHGLEELSSAVRYREYLLELISPHCGRRILEVGAGLGDFAVQIDGGRTVIATDTDTECVETLRQRFDGSPNVDVQYLDILNPGEVGVAVDSVVAINVLEHIEDDVRALQIVNRKLKPGGRTLLSVPAYMWLWGQQDAVNQHCRRYTLRELRQKLQAADFTIERMTYFNTFLFPPIAAIRLIARHSDRPHRKEGDFAYARKSSNAVLLTLFAAERLFLRYLNFPFGVSIFAAARKSNR